MAENRLTYNEAKKMLNNPNSFASKLSSNRFVPLLTLESQTDFPSLKSTNAFTFSSKPKNVNSNYHTKKRKIMSPTTITAEPSFQSNKSQPARPNYFNKHISRESPFSNRNNIVEKITEFIENIFGNNNYIFDKQMVREKLETIVNLENRQTDNTLSVS